VVEPENDIMPLKLVRKCIFLSIWSTKIILIRVKLMIVLHIIHGYERSY